VINTAVERGGFEETCAESGDHSVETSGYVYVSAPSLALGVIPLSSATLRRTTTL
jgi:hypothetical protein